MCKKFSPGTNIIVLCGKHNLCSKINLCLHIYLSMVINEQPNYVCQCALNSEHLGENQRCNTTTCEASPREERQSCTGLSGPTSGRASCAAQCSRRVATAPRRRRGNTTHGIGGTPQRRRASSAWTTDRLRQARPGRTGWVGRVNEPRRL